MRLLPSAPSHAAPVDPLHGFAGTHLMVLYADSEELQPARQRGAGAIHLSAGFSLSEEDAYLVVPDDIGDELVRILRDADHGLLEEVLDESLLVRGDLVRDPTGGPLLAAEYAVPVSQALERDLPYGAMVPFGGGFDPVRRLNALDHVQRASAGALIDETGLADVLGNRRYVGVSWRSPAVAPELATLAPTYVVSRHLAPGRVGLELALFVEDDELIALVRPAELHA